MIVFCVGLVDMVEMIEWSDLETYYFMSHFDRTVDEHDSMGNDLVLLWSSSWKVLLVFFVGANNK